MTTYNVSAGTTMEQQTAITQSIVQSMKTDPNGWAVQAAPGDQQGAIIAQNIVTNAQATVSTSPGSSTADAPTQPTSWWDNVLNAMSASGGASGVASGVAAQQAAAGSTPGSVSEAAGGGAPTTTSGYVSSAQSANAATSTALGWVQANLANYGLVILGVVLGVGALLVSQKSTIVNVGKTAAKVAAL